MGERHIEVLNFGRAVTPGDTLVYLPQGKDPAARRPHREPDDVRAQRLSRPSGCGRWRSIDALDATTIVTGHGPPLHDKTLLHATMDVFRVLLREGKAAKEKGLTPDQAKDAILSVAARSDGEDHRRRSGAERRVQTYSSSTGICTASTTSWTDRSATRSARFRNPEMTDCGLADSNREREGLCPSGRSATALAERWSATALAEQSRRVHAGLHDYRPRSNPPRHASNDHAGDAMPRLVLRHRFRRSASRQRLSKRRIYVVAPSDRTQTCADFQAPPS